MTKNKKYSINLSDITVFIDVLNEVPVLIDGINDKLKITFWNKKCEEVTGYSSDEVLNFEKPLKILYPNPKYLQKKMELLNEKGNALDGGEWEVVSKSGEKKTIVWTNLQVDPPILGANMWGIGIDITEQKKIQKNLLESEENYLNMIEHDLFGVFIVHNDKIVFANKGFSKILGFELNEVLTWDMKRANKQVHPEDLVDLWEDLNEFPNKIFRIITKSGKIKWISQNNSIITFKGEKSNLILFFDITEQKKAKEKILEFQIEEEKRESLELLAGGIAHDFNNLLVSIMGNVNLLQLSDNLSSENSSYLSEIEKASTRAKGLTRQLITFSKGATPVIKTVNLKELINESVTLVRAGTKCVFDMTYECNNTNIEADSGQIVQVLNNLLINAVQSMPEGGEININVEDMDYKDLMYSDLPKRDYLKISIADSGEGIPEEKKDKIFTPYFTTKKKGSGLGLATSYSIIRKHKGIITFQSKLGQGTTFQIILPKSKEIPQKKDFLLKKSNKTFSGKVLLMDDEKSIRNTLKQMLNLLGFEVDAVEKGEEAIELYSNILKSSERYTLVIMDLTIPMGLGGKETMVELRKMDPNVRAIVSSGYYEDSVMGNAEKYGFCGVLEKPYTFEELKSCIGEILVQKKSI